MGDNFISIVSVLPEYRSHQMRVGALMDVVVVVEKQLMI